MDYSKISLVEVKAIAKERGIKVTGLKKQEIIDVLMQNDAGKQQEDKKAAKAADKAADKPAKKDSEKAADKTVKKSADKSAEKPSKKTRGKSAENAESNVKAKVEVKAEAKTEAKTESNAKAKIEAEPEPKQETKAEANTESKAETKAESKDELKKNVPQNNSAYSNAQQNNVQQGGGDRNNGQHRNPLTDMEQLDSGEVKSGILEVMGDGYGFIRCDNYLPGDQDVYVSPALIRRFGLRTGDIVEGNTRIKSQNEKFSALLYLKNVNGYNPAVLAKRSKFEDLTPIFPNERIHLETAGSATSMRMVDLISPIGKGQRGMIVSQPKTGKTTLLKQVAKAVTKNHPEMHLIILLIDERPEEVTDIKESIEGEHVEVIYSTFDELPDNHKRVSEMVIERAKRLVEHGRDVMILLDSITRLARAYNLTIQPSGRTLSGGLDPAALYMPKRFFGAARNMREGGSLTILATALVDTGSRMDDVVFEEFKGTGNMELVLDRNLSEKRIFPAIDLPKSSTRREDLLLSQPELEASYLMRKALNGMKSDEAVEQIINMFMRTKNNNEFIEMIKKVKIV